jgi:hypothetical protein
MPLEFHNEQCPMCKDIMDVYHDNYYPVWNEIFDDITCWWCLYHPVKPLENIL